MKPVHAMDPLAAAYRVLFEEHALPMWIYDRETFAFLDVNASAISLYGYSREEFVRMTLFDIRDADQAEALRSSLAEASVTGRRVAARHRTRDGHTLEVDILTQPVDYQGRHATLVTVIDNTAKLQAEAERQQLDEVLRTITEHIPEAVYLKDTDGRYIFINASGAALAGATPEEMIGRTDEEMFSAEAAAVFRAHDVEAMKAPSLREEKVWLDNSEATFLASKAPWRDKAGKLLGIIGISRDITAARAAQQSRRELAARFTQVFEHAPIGMAMMGLDGHWLHVNRTMCEMLGYAEPDLRCLTSTQITHPDDQVQSDLQEMQLVTGQASRVHAVKRYITKDGRTVWAERTATLVRNEDNAPSYFILQVKDITHEREMEEALAQFELQYKVLVDTMADGFLLQDHLGRIIHVNPAAERILGLDYDQLMGRTLLDPRWQALREDGADFPAAELPPMLALQSGGEVQGVLMGFYNSIEKEHVWVIVNAVPQETRNGEQCVYTTLSDVTPLRRAEQALRASEERLRVLLENANDLILVVDHRGTVTFATGSSLWTLGYHPRGLVGLNAFDLVHEADQDAAHEMFGALMAYPDVLAEVELRLRHRNGNWRVLAFNAANMIVHPAIEGIVINAHDLTEARATESMLRQREEELRQSQKLEAIGRLAGGIAHDFNNVLTAITGHADLLRDMFEENDERLQDIAEIQQAADRAAALTRQLLAFSRRQVLQPVVLDIREVVNDMEKMLRRVIGEDVIMSTDVAPATRHLVKADRTQIEQVLLNLAVNARDAMPNGGSLTITIDQVDARDAVPDVSGPVPDGVYVRLSVLDTGEGIDPAVLPNIFEPFFTTKERGQGTGLGLATVYGIVRQSAGYIGVTSAPGAGTRFDVLLPCAEEAAPTEIARIPASPPQGPSGGETILIVEDEPAVRSMAERVLKRAGYPVITASNGFEALEIAAVAERIHLVLTDVVMPQMSGRELACQLAARHPSVRVLFMSGYTYGEMAEEEMIEDELQFLPKPFTPQDLVAKIRSVLAI